VRDGDGNDRKVVAKLGSLTAVVPAAVIEHQIQQRLLLACSRGPVRLFRNNVGTGWAGQSTRVTHGNLRAVASQLQPGDVVIRQGRPLHAGLCVGSSDLLGWRTVDGLAQFVAVEVKSERGRVSPEQQRFIEAVQVAGGCAGIARSVEDARKLLATASKPDQLC